MEHNRYHSLKHDLRQELITVLNEASSKIIIAMYCFTDKVVFNKLLELKSKGITIELLVYEDDINKKCGLDYEKLNEGNSFFSYISSSGKGFAKDHMKMCIIDYNTVIDGSVNWTKTGFGGESTETLNIAKDDTIGANVLIGLFEELIRVNNLVQDKQKVDLDISKAFKVFDLIKALVSLGETSKIQPYIHELKEIEELKTITVLLLNGEFDKAFIQIDEFKKNYSQLVDIIGIEKDRIRLQIKLLSNQIEVAEVDKTEIEAKIDQFNHKYVIELNPLISKILSIKRKIYEKLKKHGIVDDTYDKIDEEFKRRTEDYHEELKSKIPELNNEETADMKQMFREAAKLCHPDTTKLYEDKEEAAKVFRELDEAVKRNDIEKVKYIWSELKNGKAISEIGDYDELEHLILKLESLKTKLNHLDRELLVLRESEAYRIVVDIDNWDDYFETKKIMLEHEYDLITEKYTKNE